MKLKPSLACPIARPKANLKPCTICTSQPLPSSHCRTLTPAPYPWTTRAAWASGNFAVRWEGPSTSTSTKRRCFFWQMGRNLRILLWNWGTNWKNSHLQKMGWMFWMGIPIGIPIPTYGIWWAGAELREVLYGDLKRPLVLANAVGLLVWCDLMRDWYNEDVIDDINNMIIYIYNIYIYTIKKKNIYHIVIYI